jgi:hypothetical protein
MNTLPIQAAESLVIVTRGGVLLSRKTVQGVHHCHTAPAQPFVSYQSQRRSRTTQEKTVRKNISRLLLVSTRGESRARAAAEVAK